MPSKQIRQAIHDYFVGTSGIAQLSKDEPYFTPGQAWINNGLPGTACFVHIETQNESWVTLGGVLGQRRVIYDVALVVEYQYTIQTTNPTFDGWVDGLDQLLDDIVLKLRQDPTLGCGGDGPVWQAGTENMDLVIQRQLPVRNAGKIWSTNFVMFKVNEIVGGLG